MLVRLLTVDESRFSHIRTFEKAIVVGLRNIGECSESGSGRLLVSSQSKGNEPERERSRRGRKRGEKAAAWKRCVEIP
jgi:hypothetical protein